MSSILLDAIRIVLVMVATHTRATAPSSSLVRAKIEPEEVISPDGSVRMRAKMGSAVIRPDASAAAHQMRSKMEAHSKMESAEISPDGSVARQTEGMTPAHGARAHRWGAGGKDAVERFRKTQRCICKGVPGVIKK